MIIVKWLAFLLMGLALGVYAVNNELVVENMQNVPEQQTTVAGKFKNTEPVNMANFWNTLKIAVRFFTEKKVDAEPAAALPISTITKAQLEGLSIDELHIIKLGHSSILLKVMDEFWLIDPVFGERASPFSFLGPKRFQQTPISIEDLPPIDKVLISHNHYDHLDKYSISKLVKTTKEFLVPLGVEQHLKKWGVAEDQIKSFAWWQSQESNGSRVVFTPTKHFSGRGLTDGNNSLWGSWVIDTPAGKLFFSGDSGYFSGFSKIGEQYGPFDVTFIETGAYDPLWADIHMTPEQSVQAHIDLKGKTMIPIHNGTFDLAFHAWYEPLERVLDAAWENGVNLSTPIVGQVVETNNSLVKERWWQSFVPAN